MSHSRTQTVLILIVTSAASLPAHAAQARTEDFNRGWRFTKGDPEGAHEFAHDDASWVRVRTPHDWAIRGPFDPDANGYAAKLPWQGVGWYRKWVTLDEREEGSHVYLDFDGVMAFPRVYVNGELAGEWDYGYTPFRVDITPHVRFGRANVVAVRVDTRRHRTRWYPGAGIYRKVTLEVSPPVHLAHHGTAVTTPDVTDDRATVVVTNEVENHLEVDQDVEVEVAIEPSEGPWIASSSQAAATRSGQRLTVRHEFTIDDPLRWDIDSPNLYKAITLVRVGGRIVERRVTPFGIRTFRFTTDDGFHLNGRRVQLYGVNLHHGHGPLGAAFNERAMERQLEIMQDMGVNAIRTSHNPPAAELLDLCDRRGLLVWDELFDKWDGTAGRVDGSPPFEEHMARHARSLVRRDRNHPSIVVWSIGNEISNQPHDPEGKSRERVAYAREQFLQHDPTRPVGLGCHIPETANSDILADLDLTGWNYQRRYARFRERFPDKPIVYSESASALSSRGHYALPLPSDKCDYSPTHQLNAYELTAAPWADIAEVEFELMRRDDFVAGEFVWTGFDYLGEPTPFSQEARSSYFGVVDLVGLPKDRFYLYRSYWRPDATTLHIAPHWNWPGREGQTVPVFVYTNGDSAELFLNGESLGRRRKGQRPARPDNLSAGAQVAASSQAPENPASLVVDEQGRSSGHGWRAASSDDAPWVSVDLGKPHNVRSVMLEFPRESKLYGYTLEASSDGSDWRALVEHEATREPTWGGVKEAIHLVDVEARRLRVKFGDCLERARPALVRLAAYETPVESDYYLPTYEYRLRWNDVTYQPGELKAVAYKDGEMIAERTVSTAGEPAGLRLTPDRRGLEASGEDLAYVTVEAVDKQGVPCPRAANSVAIELVGPCEVAGVGNGDPTSLAPFLGDSVRLFNGKAMIILRPTEGLGGAITLRAAAEGLDAATVEIHATRR